MHSLIILDALNHVNTKARFKCLQRLMSFSGARCYPDTHFDLRGVVLSFISSGLAGNHHRNGGGRQATEEGCYRLFSVAAVASAIGIVGTCGN